MRIRLGRRTTGPTAAHNSLHGPRSTPKISGIQRNAIYLQIMDQTGAAAYPFDKQGNLHAVGREVLEELADNLQLILEGLGLGMISSGADVVLDLPSEHLRRTFVRLRERAVERREASSEGSDVSQEPYERALIVIEACDRVLAVAGGDAEAAPI